MGSVTGTVYPRRWSGGFGSGFPAGCPDRHTSFVNIKFGENGRRILLLDS